MKTLVLAEKKSQAEDLSAGLEKYGGKFKQGNRFLENDEYIVTWAEGHIMSLMEPRDHDNWGDRKWSLEALPWYPPNFDFTYKIGKERIYNQLKPVFNRSDIKEIIISTDAGREGTLIAHELIDHFGMDVPLKRFYESAVLTPKNIQYIIENDLKGEEFIKPRRDAAYARAFADLLLGMNFTIAFSVKAGPTLSMGRVKTPTMAILAKRKKEILDFKEETYFELEADFDGVYKGLWFKDKLGNTRFSTEEEIQKVVEKIKGSQGTITKKDVTESKENPKFLFNLNDLQGEANSKFGFDPSETLDIAQSLYDTHKILSYPRTESRVIGTEHEKMLPSILESVNIEPYKEYVQKILEDGIPTTKRLVDDKKLSDHHALIPTEIKPDLSKLNPKERKIYDLVVKRFLAAFYPPALYEKTEVVTEVEGETFKTSGRIEVDKGWKVLYSNNDGNVEEDEDEENEKESTIPPIEKGETREVSDTKSNPKKTSPPKLYTYKQLLNAMESPKRFLATKELKDALDSAESEAGLGTVATRANILTELMDREYIVKKGKNIDITDFGMKLVEVSPEELKSPEITAEWEGKLREMELGKYDFDEFMEEIQEYIESILKGLNTTEWTVTFPRPGAGKEIANCPHCGTAIREVGKAYMCETHTMENACFGLAVTIGKKKISETNVKELAKDGETKTIKGFTAKSGKKFDAKLKLDGKKLAFEFGSSEEVAKCPHCSKGIYDKGKVYACETGTREESCFIVAKTIGKKNISTKNIKDIVEKGSTALIKGFTSKNGKKFDAKLKLDGKKITFEFENNTGKTQKTDIECPFCGKGEIQENSKAFGCNNWKEGCKFTLWKNGNAVKLKHVEKLISEGETGRIDGLKGKSGKPYSANFKIDLDSKKIDREFVND